MFDNSVFMGETSGTTAAAVKTNGRYHILGRHVVANAKQIKELFDAAMPIFRAARGAELLIIGPLPRYLVNPCCSDSGHITTSLKPDTVSSYVPELKRWASTSEACSTPGGSNLPRF